MKSLLIKKSRKIRDFSYLLGKRYMKGLIDENYKENIQKIKNSELEIYCTNCDYCGYNIYLIWDKYNKNNYWPYLGIQSTRKNSYKYSPIIEVMRISYEKQGLDWSTNPLANSHTRIHSNIKDKELNKKIRTKRKTFRILCNNCFKKTYNRFLIKGNDGNLYSISVLEEKGETVESVMEELDIEGEILGKGSIKDYN